MRNEIAIPTTKPNAVKRIGDRRAMWRPVKERAEQIRKAKRPETTI
jgi:hypothetical protein